MLMHNALMGRAHIDLPFYRLSYTLGHRMAAGRFQTTSDIPGYRLNKQKISLYHRRSCSMEELKAGDIAYSAHHWPLDPEKPTLVFIHGAGMNYLFWKSQIEALGRQANTLALDLPGHGRTRLPGSESITTYADFVREFIHDIGAPRPVPCGLSMGGAIVQRLLIDYPDDFAAGILINTGARLKVMPLIFDTIKKNYADFVDMLVSFAVSPESNPEQLRPLIEACMRCDPMVVIGDFKACDRFDAMGQLDTIAVPVLVMTGGDDKLTPVKYGAFLQQNITSAVNHHIENVGHLSPLEKPEAVNRAINEFLEESLR
jgi:pimeloyl-ACP methyl ester carboxylesterase